MGWTNTTRRILDLIVMNVLIGIHSVNAGDIVVVVVMLIVVIVVANGSSHDGTPPRPNMKATDE